MQYASGPFHSHRIIRPASAPTGRARRTILTLMLAPALCLSIAGCGSGDETVSAKTYNSGATQVNAVVIDVRDRSVSLKASPDDQVHIGYSESDTEYYDIDVSHGTLTMRSASDKHWYDYIGVGGSSDHAITVSVPAESLDSLSVSTSKQDISMDAITVADDVTLSNNGGDIDFALIDAGKAVKLTVKNGDIKGTLAGGYGDYAITTTIKKGDSNLPTANNGGDRSLDVTANNGDVDVSFQS